MAYFEKRLAKLIAKRDALATRANETQDINELRSINAQLDEINGEIDDVKEEVDARSATPVAGAAEPAAVPDGAQQRGFNPIASFAARQSAPAPVADAHDTPEYRTAFMEYVCRGVEMPAEMRATTTTTDMSAVIPTTILNEIIQKLDTYGNIWNRVRKINVQGGVEIPILSLKPEASWITEQQSSTDKKMQINTSISFSYYGLECKISQSILTSVVVLAEFEKLFVSLVVEAMIRALETAIISGTGSGQMLGITKDSRVPTANVIEMTEADFGNWTKWKKNVFAKMKKAYRNGVFVMAQSTFDAHIDAMTDTTGQPIGRVNYGIDGGEIYRFGGKTVETVEETLIADFDTAESGAVVAIFCNFNDYVVNTNMQITTTRWVDNNSNEIKNKALMFVDGKLADPNGVLIIKKKVNSG